MGNKKGVKHYSKEFIEQIVAAREKGASICEISRKYEPMVNSLLVWAIRKSESKANDAIKTRTSNKQAGRFREKG